VIRDPSMSIDLLEIISEEMFAYGVEVDNGGSVDVSGPPVRLLPQNAETLGLVIHELATNAVKYGALSTQAGRIAITWERREEQGESWLDFTWEETGASVDPIGSGDFGFGMELLQKAIPRTLGGRTSLDFRSDGLRCRIEIPLRTP